MQLLCSDTVNVCVSVARELVIVRTHNSCSYFGDINVRKTKKDPRHSLQSIVVFSLKKKKSSASFMFSFHTCTHSILHHLRCLVVLCFFRNVTERLCSQIDAQRSSLETLSN